MRVHGFISASGPKQIYRCHMANIFLLLGECYSLRTELRLFLFPICPLRISIQLLIDGCEVIDVVFKALGQVLQYCRM